MFQSVKNMVAMSVLMLLPIFMVAQESNLGNWLIYIGSKQLDSKWNLHHEVQYRNYNAIGDLEQLLLRTGLGYAVAPKTNLLLGYGFIRSENYIGLEEKVGNNEHRIFQQLITKQNVGSISLQHRYRFEQRILEDDFKLRVRYFLGINVPLKSTEEMASKWYLSLYNEIFLNTVQSVFDRNRLYVGLGYKLNSSIKFEAGYMNQFLNGGNRDQINLLTFANF